MKIGELVYDLLMSDLGIIIEKNAGRITIHWWWPTCNDGIPIVTTENHCEFAEHKPMTIDEPSFCLFNNKEKYERRFAR